MILHNLAYFQIIKYNFKANKFEPFDCFGTHTRSNRLPFDCLEMFATLLLKSSNYNSLYNHLLLCILKVVVHIVKYHSMGLVLSILMWVFFANRNLP